MTDGHVHDNPRLDGPHDSVDSSFNEQLAHESRAIPFVTAATPTIRAVTLRDVLQPARIVTLREV